MLEATAQISTIVAGLAVVIYVFGVVALWIPIKRVYAQDYYTAAYAISVIPRTVVASQGFRTFVGLPLQSLLFSSVPIAALILFSTQAPHHDRATSSPVVTSVAISIVAVIVVAIVGRHLKNHRAGNLRFAMSGENWTRLWRTVSFAVSLIAGLLALQILLRTPENDIGEITLAVAIYLAVSLFGAVPAVALQDPPLPTVRIQKRLSADTTKEVTGKLVAHSDGVWYFFNPSSKELMAIPDEVVTDIIIEQGAST